MSKGSRSAYDVREALKAQLMADIAADTEQINPDDFPRPYPSVVDRYVMLDFAQTAAGERASDTFRIDPGAVRASFGGGVRPRRSGEGLWYQTIPHDFWIPEVAGAGHHDVYFLCADKLGQEFEGHVEPISNPVCKFYVLERKEAAGVTTRLHLMPTSGVTTAPFPVPMEAMNWSVSTLSGKLTFPQMRYTCTATFDGAGNATLAVGAGHGLLVNEWLVPMTGRMRETSKHGVQITAVAATTVTVSVSAAIPAGSEAGAVVIVLHRWVVPTLHTRALGHAMNYTGP